MSDENTGVRLDALEVLAASLAAQLEEVTLGLSAAGIADPAASSAGGPTGGSPGGTEGGITAESVPPRHRFDSPEQWVNQIYTVLAAGSRLPWCPRWWEHAEAYERLTYLWQSWEAAVVTAATDQSAMATWLRDQFDHHRAVLQSRDGPFADCVNGHRAVASWLDLTDPAPNADGFTTDDAARLFLSRQHPPQPAAPSDEERAAYAAASARFFAQSEQEEQS